MLIQRLNMKQSSNSFKNNIATSEIFQRLAHGGEVI